MYIRLAGAVLLVVVLVHVVRLFRPTRYGLVFGLLMFYIPLHFKIPLNALPMVNALTATMVALVILLPADRGALLRHARAFRGLVVAFCGVSVLGLALAAGGAANFSTTIVEFKRWLDPVVFGLLAFAITRDEDRKFTMACMMLGYALVAVHGIREGLDYGTVKRIPGLLGQPNETGAFLAMYAPFGLTLALLLLRGFARTALIGVTALGGWALIPTLSRGAWIAYGLGMAVALIAARRKGMACAALALGIVLLGVVPEILPERVTARFEETVLDEGQAGGESLEESLEPSAAARITQWKSALAAIASNPIGVGFGRFKGVIGGYGGISGLDAHNFFLLVGVEFGVAGMALAIALFGKMAADAWAVATGATDPFVRAFGCAACAMILAAVIVNCFGSRLMQDQPSTYLWALAAMSARARDMLASGPVAAVAVPGRWSRAT
ncbi:MAG TPA: O-antigen ligase family protein [Methylomirabilota bacterium]|jgi:O-antigen ligase|nr:O-antigen ligase family protein [Methylomirabilota bacterium]